MYAIRSYYAYRLARSEGIKQAAGVDAIAELRRRDLQRSDELADPIQKWAIGLATAEGTAAGLGGFFVITSYSIHYTKLYDVFLCFCSTRPSSIIAVFHERRALNEH